MSTCAPWATIADVCAPCDEYDFDPALLELGLQIASDHLYNATRQRWPGICTDTIRPCGLGSSTRWSNPSYRQSNAHLFGWCGCHSARSCGCRGLSEIRLPRFPVVSVDEVKIDGAVVDPALYRPDGRWLVWVGDEPRSWPCCQRLDLEDTEEETYSISYTYGTDPPPGGVNAAAILGCQIALACQGASACRLPKRVQTITRQGVTMTILDPLTLFADGLTGIPEVDMWVSGTLLGDRRRRARVRVPGQTPNVRRTGTSGS